MKQSVQKIVRFHTRCTCGNETLKCNNGFSGYFYNPLKHIKIKIRNENFTAKIIDFRFNDLRNLTKNEILPGHESKVEALHFYYNNIATIEDGTFDKFTSLKILSMKFNELKSMNDTILTKQLGSTLTELDLSMNGLKNLSTSVFQHLTKLTSLNLHENSRINLISKINGINVTIFPEALSNLKTLDLRLCNIKTLDDNIFINLRSLESLDISHNPLKTIPKAIKSLSNIRYLNLGSSEIVSINDCDFCNLPNLKTLLFTYSFYLTNINENAFGALNNASTVPQLNEFSIQSCNVSVLPEKLLNWKNLSKIDIKHNPITCNCSMAWLINDYNATTPMIVDKMIDYRNNSYKNDLYCSSPSSFGPHLHTLAGDFCSNKTELTDIKDKSDEIYHVCKENDDNGVKDEEDKSRF
uniref:Uncharacterized protein n=1 Tax=Panagrolaimus superbus TaxID=310955 RepID=A0A914Y3W9_9BILA